LHVLSAVMRLVSVFINW